MRNHSQTAFDAKMSLETQIMTYQSNSGALPGSCGGVCDALACCLCRLAALMGSPSTTCSAPPCPKRWRGCSRNLGRLTRVLTLSNLKGRLVSRLVTWAGSILNGLLLAASSRSLKGRNRTATRTDSADPRSLPMLLSTEMNPGWIIRGSSAVKVVALVKIQ